MTTRQPYRLHHAIGYQLTITARQQERRFEAALKALDLSRITWCVLLAVGDEGLCHPSDIAQFIGIDRTATSRALRKMEEDGLIQRDGGTEDRRTTRVSLTKLGQDKLAQSQPMAEANRNRTEAQLTPDELAELRRLLAKLRQDDDGTPLKRL